MSGLPHQIFKHWIHFHEEDTEDIKVYRPHDYPFPRSRGRRGFEIKENGEFIQYDIAPDDRSERVEGRWTAEGTNKIRIHLKDQKSKSYTLDIISCNEDVLIIKKQ